MLPKVCFGLTAQEAFFKYVLKRFLVVVRAISDLNWEGDTILQPALAVASSNGPTA
jgi:hypothetical protein